MQTLTENVIKQGLRDRALTELQLERVLGGKAPRRYGLVNRALKAGELLRIRRGLYVLAPEFRNVAAHPFAIAQAVEPGSYVSFETALSYHGWIPERVRTTASVVRGRKSSIVEHPTLGMFSFHPLALNRGRFLELVQRQEFGNQTALIAAPLRALMDLICHRKLEWQGKAGLVEGLRIDPRNLRSLTRADVEAISGLYKQQRPNRFLRELAKGAAH